jgi:uncharacterized membrane protein
MRLRLERQKFSPTTEGNMESKAKLLGHPVHPMLIVFPLGLLATAVVFDGIAIARDSTTLFLASYWMIGAGVMTGAIAAVFGLIDWLAIPAGTRAKTIGLWHGLGNGLVTMLYALSWILRRPTPENPSGPALTLSFLGLLIALITGWLGGELVDRLGVGVDDGAHLDSPSSLSGEPANRERKDTGIRRVA